MRVPYHIYQTWETELVPPQWRHAQSTVLQMNGNFEYSLVTDADRYRIIHEHMPTLVHVLRSYPHAVQRADLIRYVIMYIYGGLYLDLDYVCLQNLSPLVDSLPDGCDVGLVPSNNSRGHVTNSVLISRPGAEFWLEVIPAASEPPPWWAITKHATVFATTGPLMMNRVLQQHVHRERIHIFPDAVVPCDTCTLTQCQATGPQFFLLPIVGKPWHHWDSSVTDWCYCNRKLLIVIFLVFFIGWMYAKTRRTRKQIFFTQM